MKIKVLPLGLAAPHTVSIAVQSVAPRKNGRGMPCPNCGTTQTRVALLRHAPEYRERVWKCAKCHTEKGRTFYFKQILPK